MVMRFHACVSTLQKNLWKLKPVELICLESSSLGISLTQLMICEYTVMRNYGMNKNFADVNPERDFQPFNDEKNSHLRTKIS